MSGSTAKALSTTYERYDRFTGNSIPTTQTKSASDTTGHTGRIEIWIRVASGTNTKNRRSAPYFFLHGFFVCGCQTESVDAGLTCAQGTSSSSPHAQPDARAWADPPSPTSLRRSACTEEQSARNDSTTTRPLGFKPRRRSSVRVSCGVADLNEVGELFQVYCQAIAAHTQSGVPPSRLGTCMCLHNQALALWLVRRCVLRGG